MITPKRAHARWGILLAAAALTLSGCAPTATPAAEAKSSAAGEAVTISDAWVKSAESGMTAVFGTLNNPTDADVTLVSATSKAADRAELHEVTENDSGSMEMRAVDGGFVIPAGGSMDIQPGGYHIMLMGLTDPLQAGEDVTVTVTFSDDSSYEFTAPVKDYSGANENYDDIQMDHDSMNHDDMDHENMDHNTDESK